jgi:hypothetical protein
VVHSREAKCFATAISGSGMQDSVSVFYVYSQDDKKLVAKEVHWYPRNRCMSQEHKTEHKKACVFTGIDPVDDDCTVLVV